MAFNKNLAGFVTFYFALHFILGKTQIDFSQEMSFGRLGVGVLPCDVSPTPKKY